MAIFFINVIFFCHLKLEILHDEDTNETIQQHKHWFPLQETGCVFI